MSVCRPPDRNSNRHQGGVRFISGPKSHLRYRAHYNTTDAQVLVAPLPCVLIVAGVYLAPLRGRKSVEDVLTWVKRWMRGRAVLLGDLNSRHIQWDNGHKTYGTAVHEWANASRFKITAPSSPTLVNNHEASTVDLFVTTGVRTKDVRLVAGTHDYDTDHRLVKATIFPLAESTMCRIPSAVLRDGERRRCAAKH